MDDKLINILLKDWEKSMQDFIDNSKNEEDKELIDRSKHKGIAIGIKLCIDQLKGMVKIDKKVNK